jgi:F-type H+-transporting ATPase subunit gamma
MPSLKEYKAKLASTANTRKITSTMKMVAASKMSRTTDAQRKATAYATRLNEMISRLAATVDPTVHPLLQARPHPKKCLIVVFTSDKGMCGGFNSNLIKFVSRWIHRPPKRYDQIDVSCCGRRGFLFFRQRGKIKQNYEGVTARPTPAQAVRIGREIMDSFLSGEYDEIYLAYNHFISPLSQKPTMLALLPIESHEIEVGEHAIHANYILEPEQHELLAVLLPKTVEFDIYYALLENAAGENGARMTAMDNATRNADEMIRMYTLLRNRARQASITKELIEIVSGAEALKG